MIKGKNQHVMPSGHGDQGWCVVDEANLMVVKHFDSREAAMSYAQQCATEHEGDVLVHMTHCDPHCIGTVPLPQEHFSPEYSTCGHATPFAEGIPCHEDYCQPSKAGVTAGPVMQTNANQNFDPLLGFDSGHFEI